jgi:predicted small metal-binding protein
MADGEVGAMKEVQCSEDLRIEGCDFAARGETPGEAAEEMVEHLRETHDLDMPDAEAIMEGKIDEARMMDEETETVVERLREALGISEVGVRDDETIGEETPAAARKK